MINIQCVKQVQEMLQGCMAFIDGVIDGEPFDKENERYEDYHVDRLDDIKWDISQAEIHAGRLVKNMQKGGTKDV